QVRAGCAARKRRAGRRHARAPERRAVDARGRGALAIAPADSSAGRGAHCVRGGAMACGPRLCGEHLAARAGAVRGFVPRVSVWLARAALVHLALGFTLGALLLVSKALGPSPALWRLRPAHVQLVLFGWTVQLVMAVAVWIFPRVGLRGTPPGRTRFAWVAFA